MAINKTAIQVLIDAYTANINLYITTNNNKEITGVQLKSILDESASILEEIKTSYFILGILHITYPPSLFLPILSLGNSDL